MTTENTFPDLGNGKLLRDGIVLTPAFRVSFPSVFEKGKLSEKYELDALFRAGQDLSLLKQIAKAAAVGRWGDKVKTMKLRSPFRDQSEKEYDGYEPGSIFCTFRASKLRPGVVDQGRQEITDPADFYGGCYARASVNAYAYGGPGTKFKPGVAFGLNNVQKVADGEPFGNRSNPDEDFEPLEGSEDDPGAYEGGASDSAEEDFFGNDSGEAETPWDDGADESEDLF